MLRRLTLVMFFILMNLVSDAVAARVHITIIDSDDGHPTPAMVCISDGSADVRLPPDGRPLIEPTDTSDFFSGVPFNPSPDWIGPVRKTTDVFKAGKRLPVYGNSLTIPYWNEPVIYQTQGEFNIELPEGKWRIAFDHGLEYIPVYKTIEVRTDKLQKVRIEMKRWVNMPKKGWWSGDVHVHHPTKDSAYREFLLHYAKAADLHVANILEMGHHLGTDFKQEGFGEKFRRQMEDYWLVSGQEDPRSAFGHIIGLNISGMVRDVSTYDFYDLTFKGIHRQPGALVGFAHFAWDGCNLPEGFPWYVTTEELDFVELLQFSRINGLDYYDYLNLGFKLTAAAGSDVPWGGTMGEVRTFVQTGDGKNLDIDGWFAGLKAGHTFVTNGPILDFTVDGALPGTELERQAGDTVKIKARVLSHKSIGIPKKMMLIGNEGTIREIENPKGKTDLSFDLKCDIAGSQWFILGAVCDNNAVAHTSPVYVKVDGKPHWSRAKGPKIIEQQLAEIDRVAQKIDPSKGEREKGLIERMDRAREYYNQLLEKMEK